MEFTEAQQKVIDGLINKRVAEVKSKAESATAAAIAEAEAKALSELEKLKVDNNTLQQERDGQNDRIRVALLKAEVSQSSAVNVDTVVKLVSEHITTGDDGNLQVIDGSGTVRYDGKGRPLSVKAYLDEYLTENPYLAKAAPSGGSGSHAAPFGNTGATSMRRADFDKLDASRRTSFVRSGGQVKN